jgi:ABC-type nickel/cobalt efflux system permease component RcnA
MGSLTQDEEIVVLKHTVGSTCRELYTQYMQYKGNQAPAITNDNILSVEYIDRKNELDALRTRVDTADQEYTDRMSGDKMTTLRMRGIFTQQDWILLFFFVSYGLACCSLILYVMSISLAPGRAAAALALVASVIGVMIAKTLTVIA